MSVRSHYDDHLAGVYSWMAGDFDDAVTNATSLLAQAGVTAGSGPAVDLGAGHGVFSVALARLGYGVTAIDFCEPLLDELRRNTDGLGVTAVNDDLTAFRNHVDEPQVIVCMGDTLTHLESVDDVERVLRDAAESLSPGGRFVTTFRDYTTPAPGGTNRFIPVRADDDRILTCFLEYADDHIDVYDIIHQRGNDGWATSVSAYRKLRLEPGWVRACLEGAGLAAAPTAVQRGMVLITATR